MYVFCVFFFSLSFLSSRLIRGLGPHPLVSRPFCAEFTRHAFFFCSAKTTRVFAVRRTLRLWEKRRGDVRIFSNMKKSCKKIVTVWTKGSSRKRQNDDDDRYFKGCLAKDKGKVSGKGNVYSFCLRITFVQTHFRFLIAHSLRFVYLLPL